MKYTVGLTPKAVTSMATEAAWWAENYSVTQATRWHEGFLKAIETLSVMPKRCQLASENRRSTFDLYEFHYGTGSRPAHRALFRVQKNQVVILLVRRHSQQDVTTADLE